MADSDNTTTLSSVTRMNTIAGRAARAISPDNLEARHSSDPAAVLWREWQAAHAEVDRLCRHQQRAEADLRSGAGSDGDYAEALFAESNAGERAIHLIELMSQTPASSLAGVAAKLDAVLGEGQPSEDDPEFPWPQIRSVLEDVIRIGKLAKPLASGGGKALNEDKGAFCDRAL